MGWIATLEAKVVARLSEAGTKFRTVRGGLMGWPIKRLEDELARYGKAEVSPAALVLHLGTLGEAAQEPGYVAAPSEFQVAVIAPATGRDAAAASMAELVEYVWEKLQDYQTAGVPNPLEFMGFAPLPYLQQPDTVALMVLRFRAPIFTAR